MVGAAALLAAACSGGGGGGGAGAPPPSGGPLATLERAQQCDDLLERIQADAVEKIGVQAESLRESGWQIEQDPGGFENPIPVPAAPGPREDDADGDGAPDDFTETN